MTESSRTNVKNTCGERGGGKGMSTDLLVRFYDNYTRTFDSLKKNIDPIREKEFEQDAVVNHGVGYIEDRGLTHGISQGATNSGVYGILDLICNQKSQEYLAVNKLGQILRYDWAGNSLPPSRPPSKKFTKFLYLQHSGNYILWTPKKSGFYITKEDFSIAIDSMAVAPIGTIIYGNKKGEEGVDFFIISECTLIKYSYQPQNNVVVLQDVLKMSDIEADNAVIEGHCFDMPRDDKKQWIYLIFKKNCTIIDVTGRIHGTKKNLHDCRITAIAALGSSDYVITGDEKGLLKMWGQRWSFMASFQAHSAKVTHLLEHPAGGAVISISRDLTMFAWSVEGKKKLELISVPEMVERIAINPERHSFMTQGPRRLVIWRMDSLLIPHCNLSSPVKHIDLTWHPEFPPKLVVTTEDNAIRMINPPSGQILTTALVGPHVNNNLVVHDVSYFPQRRFLQILVEGVTKPGSMDVQHYDANLNPCRQRDFWRDIEDSQITAICFYDFVESHVYHEKEMSFSTKKKAAFTGKATFLLVGRLDGCISRVDLRNGAIEYTVPCHRGHVSSIQLNSEMNQFISAGTDPGFRLWKLALNQDEMFMPLLDVSWKFPIKHIAFARELIGFALTHPESETHKFVVFNNLDAGRYDQQNAVCHTGPILSVSGCKDLLLFCTASTDETVRIWNEKNELVRVLFLNWVPSVAAFGTKQGDIFVGIGKVLHLIPADKYLTVIYRNRVLMSELDAGPIEEPVQLNVAKSGQDPRMFVALEAQDDGSGGKEEEKKSRFDNKKGKDEASESSKTKSKITSVKPYAEPQDSQRAKDFEFLRLRMEDLQLIVEGKHPLSTAIPDPHNMTKQQWDEFGKSVFGEEDDRKFFASESRQACMNKMKEMEAELNNVDNVM